MAEPSALPAWSWPVTNGVYPDPYPFRYDADGRGICPITTSLETGRCWAGNPPTCMNDPAYVARYDCGDSDEEGLVCAYHATEARVSSDLVSIRSLSCGASQPEPSYASVTATVGNAPPGGAS